MVGGVKGIEIQIYGKFGYWFFFLIIKFKIRWSAVKVKLEDEEKLLEVETIKILNDYFWEQASILQKF